MHIVESILLVGDCVDIECCMIGLMMGLDIQIKRIDGWIAGWFASWVNWEFP